MANFKFSSQPQIFVAQVASYVAALGVTQTALKTSHGKVHDDVESAVMKSRDWALHMLLDRIANGDVAGADLKTAVTFLNEVAATMTANCAVAKRCYALDVFGAKAEGKEMNGAAAQA